MEQVNGKFFDKWDSLEAKFPDWEVSHSGGGIWLLRKEYNNLKGSPTLVSISTMKDMVVFIDGDPEKSFIDSLLDKSEVEQAEENGDATDILLYDSSELSPKASHIFSQEVLEELITFIEEL